MDYVLNIHDVTVFVWGVPTYFIGRGCSTVKPFPRKYAAVRIAALQNFVLSVVSVTIVFIG